MGKYDTTLTDEEEAWMIQNNPRFAEYVEIKKKEEEQKAREQARVHQSLANTHTEQLRRPRDHRSVEVLTTPLGGFKGSTKKDLDLGGVRMLKNAVTGQRTGNWEEDTKTSLLAGVTRPALIPASASVSAKDAIAWGLFSAGASKARGKSWSEAASDGVDGMVAGATMRMMPGNNLKGVSKVIADATKLGTLETGGSLVKGESLDTALKEGRDAALGALVFGGAGATYEKLPDPVKAAIRRAALGASASVALRGDSQRPVPTIGSFEHLTDWLGANDGRGFDDYLGTISDSDASKYAAQFKDREFTLPEGVDFFSEESMARYMLHQQMMERAKVRQAAKAGAPKRKNISQVAKFLATDNVPETIFGIPVVSRQDQYTEADIKFFEEHPEAGGYYDMGGDPAAGQGDLGSETSADIRGGYPGSWNNPGNVMPGAVVYNGENGTAIGKKSGHTFLTFATPQAGLDAMGSSIGQMVREKLPQYFAEGKIPSKDFTVHNLINVYAPPSDNNDTTGYINEVSKELGVNKHAVLNMQDPVTMVKLLRSMARRESGADHANWFNDDEYKSAVRHMSVPVTKKRRR